MSQDEEAPAITETPAGDGGTGGGKDGKGERDKKAETGDPDAPTPVLVQKKKKRKNTWVSSPSFFLIITGNFFYGGF